MGILRSNATAGFVKRLIVRLSVLTAVGVLGFFAIARAQRSDEPASGDADDATLEAVPADESSPSQPTTVAATNPGPYGTVPPTTLNDHDAYAPRGGSQSLPVTDALAESNPLRAANANNGAVGERYSTEPQRFDASDASMPVNSAVAGAAAMASRRDPFGLAGAAGSGQQPDSYAPPNAATRYAGDSTGTAAGGTPNDSYGQLYSLPQKNNSQPPQSDTATTSRQRSAESQDALSGDGEYDTGSATRLNNEYVAGNEYGGDATGASAAAGQLNPRNSRPLTAAGGSISAAIGSLPAAAAPVAAFGSDQPGTRQLEGPQSPTLTLQKIAPPEIQVGKPVKFKIAVRNTGAVAAHGVQVFDKVPQGTRLLGTKPQASAGAAGAIVWALGTLQPGDEKTLELQLMPEQEGEIGSVAAVTFRTEASVRTVATRPDLKLEVASPENVLIDEQITVKIKITNQGSGAANDIVLFDSLPPQVRHPQGSELEFDVGNLKPNESREINLTLTGANPGRVSNTIAARGDGSVSAQAQVDFAVIAPALKVDVAGPKLRYLERRAVHTFTVANPGTATAHDIQLVSHLPSALKFVSANNSGYYDPKTHAVYWSLEELPQGEAGSVKLVTVPVEPGKHTLRVETKAERDLSDRKEEEIIVEGLAALFFEVVDLEDPVEVGGETTYEVRVLNQGTKTANNIRVAALLPPQLRALAAEGPTQSTVEAGRVIFAPLQRLAPKADSTFRIRVQGVEEGDQRIRVQVQSDEMSSPVTKEESTNVYADR